jgi:restriction system protein
MALPSYEDLMRSVLEIVQARGSLTMADLRKELVARFSISEEQLRERIPSGHTTTWMNRVHWAKTYLYKAGALDSPRRGVLTANETTRVLLENNPDRVDKTTLMQLPRFQEWLTGAGRGSEPSEPSTRANSVVPVVALDDRTPREQLEAAHTTIRREIVDELLERVRAVEPEQFEHLVLRLMTALGYGGAVSDAEHLGGSGDGGVDGVIREDRLGLDLIYLQAKRWEGSVSRPTVQAFAGSLEGYRARKGVLITTSTFTREAKEYVRQIEKRIVLIDGVELAELMYDAGLGVSTEQAFELKAIDSDFFDVEVG